MKVVTLSVDIGIQVPDDVDGEDLALNIPHDLVQVQHTDGTPIKEAKVICHSTTGVVDEFTEDDVERWKADPLFNVFLGDDGP